MQEPEEHRRRWALGLSIALSAIIFLGWVVQKDMIVFGGGGKVAETGESSQLAAVSSIPSPIENSKQTFGAAFKEISKQFDAFKASVSAVFVPFITGIEVYDRK